MSFRVYISSLPSERPRARRLCRRLNKILSKALGTTHDTQHVFLADPVQALTPYLRGVLVDAEYLVICLGENGDEAANQIVELEHFLLKGTRKVLFVELRDLPAEMGLASGQNLACRAGWEENFDVLVIPSSQNSDDKIAYRLASPILDEPFDALWDRKRRSSRAKLWRLAKQGSVATLIFAVVFRLSLEWNPLEIDPIGDEVTLADRAIFVNSFLADFGAAELATIEQLLPVGAVTYEPIETHFAFISSAKNCSGLYEHYSNWTEPAEGTGVSFRFGYRCGLEEDPIATLYPWAAPAVESLLDACNGLVDEPLRVTLDTSLSCQSFNYKDLVNEGRDTATIDKCYMPHRIELSRRLAEAGASWSLREACSALLTVAP